MGQNSLTSPGVSINQSTGEVEYSIPKCLIQHFVLMTDPVKKQQVDGDLAYKCALGFPDLAKSRSAQTFWYSHLQPVFHNLANDSTWRVRQTMAANLDILSESLDSTIISLDLLPIFLMYMEDKTDEVKLALVKNLAKFFKNCDKRSRLQILAKINVFKYSENSHFWRFRAEQCSQLKYILLMIEPKQAEEFLLPTAMELLTDNIAFVRKLSLSLTAEWLIKLLQKPELIENKPTSDYSSEDSQESSDPDTSEISLDSYSSNSTIIESRRKSSKEINLCISNFVENFNFGNFDFEHYVKNQTPSKIFQKMLKRLNNLLLKSRNYKRRMLYLNLCFTGLGCEFLDLGVYFLFGTSFSSKKSQKKYIYICTVKMMSETRFENFTSEFVFLKKLNFENKLAVFIFERLLGWSLNFVIHKIGPVD